MSRTLALLPLEEGQRDLLKAFVYRRAGGLFERSPNYHYWKRAHPEKKARTRWPALRAPAEAEWDALAPRPGAGATGAPFIVVPVFRGRDETLACLFSVRSTAPNARLVVVDDATPEYGLAQRLDELARDGHFALLRNDRNLGFLRSVERGMAFDLSADVVLVNSDAIVHGDWLDRLGAAAKRSPDIGTVTPLSNNGDLASYPHARHNQVARLEVGLEGLDRIASAVNAGRVVDAPTGVGFCLYLRRACLDAMGGFDPAFSGGYGEETELCLRASAAGWRNVVATDVVVRHEGGRSFGARAQRLRDAATQRLRARHPEFEAGVETFYAEDPLREARFNIDIARLARAGGLSDDSKGSILFVSHDWGGGVEGHLEELSERLENRGVAVFLLRFVTVRSESDRIRLHLGLDPRRPGLPDLGVASALEFSDRPALVAGLRALRVAHVHLHSAGAGGAGGAVWVESIARDLGVPFDVTAHDYAAICPRHHLEDESGRYCGEPDEAGCRRCLSERGSRYGAVDVAAWRRQWHGVFAAADRVICPVEDVRRRFEARWSEPRYEVRAHPEPAGASLDALAMDSGRSAAHMTVLVPGAIGLQKGFRVVCAAAEEARRNARPIRFVVVGHTTDDAAAARAGIRVTGPYERAEADARLAAEATGSCLALLPSVSPETWGATLSSAWRVGLHPVVFDLGAYAERVRSRGQGTVLPLELADTPAALNEALLDLAASGVARCRLTRGADARRQEDLVAGGGASVDDYAGMVSAADRRSWVFVDRDGVLSMPTSGWVRSLSEWRPIPESLDAVARLTRAGHRVVVLTNQSVVGRGLAEAAIVEKIHDRLREQVAARGGRVDGIFACLHHPEDGCDCRKPASGLFHRAQSEIGASATSAPFVGDQWTDVMAAQRAGARPILVGDWAGRPPVAGLEQVERFADLASFVQAFLGEFAARSE